MSLFSTIAHEGAAPARGFSLKGIGMVAAGLALGVAVGFAIVNSRTAAEPSDAAIATATGLAYDDFVRLNSTDLDNLAPATVSAATIQSQAVVDPFIQMNTTSFDGLVPAAATAVVDPFIQINTTSYDGLVPAAATAVVDPFIQINTTSYDGLVPAASAAVVDPFIQINTTALDGLVPAASAHGQTSGNASEEFLDWNIASLEYPAARYSEQSSGPR